MLRFAAVAAGPIPVTKTSKCSADARSFFNGLISFSVATAKLVNNFGLDLDGAIYDHQNTEGYPQNSWIDETSGQAAIGGYPNTIFFIPQIINNDSLCIVKYNTSGAIVDTSNRINN